VLYAKVAGSWEPILGGEGGLDQTTADLRYVNITGDTMTGALTINGGTASPLKLVGTPNCYVPYYAEGDDTTRSAYIGFPNSAHLYVKTERPSSYLFLQAADGGVCFLCTSGEAARFDVAGNFFINKIASNYNAAGLEVGGNTGNVAVTDSSSSAVQALVLNLIGSAVVSSRRFVSFRLNNSEIGTITRNAATSAVLYNTTSDYRLKDVQGPITNGIERIERLRPLRVIWKEDETRTEVDGMLAHEVAEVVPDAVTGEKDAVAEADDEARGLSVGDQIYQQMDYSRLVPTLIAAVQELSAKVRSLRTELDALS
jgi:endosialidase-like protein